jgi:type II secretory pathway pseudopilin PulG
MINQNGFGALVVIILISALGLIIGVSWYTISRSDTRQTVNKIQNTESSDSRDSIRKQHASKFAVKLFYRHFIQKADVPINQAGLDLLQVSDPENNYIDPKTNKPYVFNKSQAKMNVGEATFKLNATCDDKIENSNGNGLIVESSASSAAIAIKLESGLFACESNL